LRGHERGPAYGPQIEELHHKCDPTLPWHRLTPAVSRDTAARVVNGKLLLRTIYSLQLSLRQPLAHQIDQLGLIGCSHSPGHFPGLVMDAIDHLGSPSKAPRCYDSINCSVCATDLRVAVLATESDQLVAQINTWQCYGGRDIDQEDGPVQSMFGYSFASKRKGGMRDYTQAPINRNLELLYNDSLGEGGSLTNGLQQRHRWLHWWTWCREFGKDTPYSYDYVGPD
jgi:hypothetical protein